MPRRPRGTCAASYLIDSVCRHGFHAPGFAWRLETDFFKPKVLEIQARQAGAAPEIIANESPWVHWQDRSLGPQQQNVAQEVGDFVLLRADGLFAYQLAVVVDDADQGITHIVRGADLTDNTARQIVLQRHLGLPTPQYLHTPLVLAANGEKLSKQNGAAALDTATPETTQRALQQAAGALGLGLGLGLNLGSSPSCPGRVADLLAAWAAEWRQRFASLQCTPDFLTCTP